MRAHYVHEPGHIDGAKRCISDYLELLPARAGELREGAAAYLGHYRRMFEQLDGRIFG